MENLFTIEREPVPVIPVKKDTSGPAAREFSDIPYAGLFGDTVMARVVEEIVADPHSVYHLKDLENLTGNSAPRIREALTMLTNLGLLKTSGGKHPAYTVDTSRKTFVALTLLAYAVLDDREGSDCMETAVRHYCETPIQPGAGGTAAAAPGYLSASATRQLAVQIAEVLEDSFRRRESTISLQPVRGSPRGKTTRSFT
jgi:hypothetical protein